MSNMANESDNNAFITKEEVKPVFCEKCGKKLNYMGLGEYVCPACNSTEYDDYGRVRVFLEANPGANVLEVEKKTGVSRHKINEMVSENRFSIKKGGYATLDE